MRERVSINKVNRNFSVLKNSFNESNFVNATAEVLLGFIWELTRELYSLKGGNDAERRLQRDVTNLIRQRD